MSKRRKIIISLFIILNILTAMIVPIKSRSDQNVLQRFFYPYALWTRLLQDWSLFTPNPRAKHIYYRFDVYFRDGAKTTWIRPYSENWDFFQRHLAYNWQKLDLAGHNLDKPFLYPDIADFIKRKFWSDANPPSKIILNRVEASWSEPRTVGFVGPILEGMYYHDRVMFTYFVSEDKFEGVYDGLR